MCLPKTLLTTTTTISLHNYIDYVCKLHTRVCIKGGFGGTHYGYLPLCNTCIVLEQHPCLVSLTYQTCLWLANFFASVFQCSFRYVDLVIHVLFDLFVVVGHVCLKLWTCREFFFVVVVVYGMGKLQPCMCMIHFVWKIDMCHWKVWEIYHNGRHQWREMVVEDSYVGSDHFCLYIYFKGYMVLWFFAGCLEGVKQDPTLLLPLPRLCWSCRVT